jgi:hypothetical protein
MRAPPRKSHWNEQARQWSRIASPLRPHRDDIVNLKRALADCAGLHLLLGVTPEYSGLFDRVVAVDNCEAMIGALWPGDTPGKDAIRADWMHLPLKESSCAAAIGDGSLNFFSCPAQYEHFFHQVQRVLGPGGRFALRVFSRPTLGETCGAVCDDALNGNIGTFHAFKWRLAMAIAAEAGDSNVRVGEIRRVFMELLPDREQLAAASGWSVEDIGTIDAYRDATASYSFPMLSEVRASFPQYFREIELMYGSYELAQCCPMFVLEARK